MAFRRLQIPVPSGLTYSPPGSAAQASPLTLQSGDLPPFVIQWFDPELATRWFQYAQRLLDALPSADAPIIPPGHDAEALPRYIAETRAVWAVLVAIANGYNALNIPWHLHQSARELYWRHFARPLNTQSQARLYDKSTNTFSGWWADSKPFPLLDSTSGPIPKKARDAAMSLNITQQYFLPSLGLALSLPSQGERGWGYINQTEKDAIWSLASTTNVIGYKPETQNRPFLIAGYDWGTSAGGGADTPFDAMCLREPQAAPPYAFPVGNCREMVDLLGISRYPMTAFVNGQPSTPYDWRAIRVDTGVRFGDVPMNTMVGPYHYIGWLSDWVALLNSQSPQDIVLEAKQFGAYWNTEVLALNQNVQQALLSPSAALQGNADLRTAAALSGTIGGALAGVTYGISAVVGAALAVSFSIAAEMPDIGLVKNTGRDDLGRWKPSLERTYLGGNPFYEDLTNGPPAMVVPEPPDGRASSMPTMPTIGGVAYDRIRGALARPSPALSRLATSPDAWAIIPADTQPPVESPGLSTGAKVAIGVTIVGVLGYAFWQSRQRA